MSARIATLAMAAVFSLPLWSPQALATPFAFDLVAQSGTGIDGEEVFLSQNDFVALNESNDVFFQGLSLFSQPDPQPTLRVAKLFLRKSGSISTLLRTDTTPGAPPPINMQIVGMGERNAFTEPTVFFSTIANGSFEQVFRLNSATPFNVANDTITTQKSSRFAVSDTGFVVRKDDVVADGRGPITRTKCNQGIGNPCDPIDPPIDMSPGVGFDGSTRPAVNASGQTAFTGRPNPLSIDLGVMVSQQTGSDPAVVTRLVSKDDPALGFPAGTKFSSFGEPDINNIGKIAFWATVVDSIGTENRAIYTINADGTGLARAVIESDLEIPGLFMSDKVKINNANEVAFGAFDETRTQSSLHMTVDGTPRLVAKTGDVIDGIATTQVSTVRFDLNDQGKLAFYGGPSTFDTGLFVASFSGAPDGGSPLITQVAEMSTSSDAILSQMLDQSALGAAGSGALDLSFDYRFLTTGGSMEVSVVLFDGSTETPNSLGFFNPVGNLFQTETLTIAADLADLMRNATDGVSLLFRLFEVPVDVRATVQLDNIILAGLSNGDFETGDLTSWRDESVGNASVSNQRVTLTSVPEPAAGSLFLAGLAGFGWLRRRSNTGT